MQRSQPVGGDDGAGGRTRQRVLDEKRTHAASRVEGVAKVVRQTAHALRAVRLESAAEIADMAAAFARRRRVLARLAARFPAARPLLRRLGAIE